MLTAILMAAVAATSARLVDAQPQNCHEFAPVAHLKGKKFFNALTGEYVPIKGVNYYPRPNEGALTLTNSIDFFTEEHRHIWERDIANFVDLGVNAIRIYAVNPGLNHDAFMCALKAAGIYVMVGLGADCLDCAIGTEPAPACYSSSLRWRGEFIINQFSKYENVLAFSAGNEVGLKIADYRDNMPCLKKFVRDMRAYISGCNAETGTRKIPVGLVVVDRYREKKARYYNCLTNPDDPLERADFFGINIYRHCSKDDTGLSGWHRMRNEAIDKWDLTISTMVTEYGCIGVSADDFDKIGEYESQRDWKQAEVLYNDFFRAAFAGGFVFEYSTERVTAELVYPASEWPFTSYGKRNLGLGYFSPKDCNDIDIPCEYIRFPEFQTLADVYDGVDTSNEPNMAGYIFDETKPEPECPSEILGLQNFTWSSDTGYNMFSCPVPVSVFCPGVPQGCTTWAPVPTPPTEKPIAEPWSVPTDPPTSTPISSSTASPSITPVSLSTASPSITPVSLSTASPSSAPIGSPTALPSGVPIVDPSEDPTDIPLAFPSSAPSGVPIGAPSSSPSETPFGAPSSLPSRFPSGAPSLPPSSPPSSLPSSAPSSQPVGGPSGAPSLPPSSSPSSLPSSGPSSQPVGRPSSTPSTSPTDDIPTSTSIIAGAQQARDNSAGDNLAPRAALVAATILALAVL